MSKKCIIFDLDGTLRDPTHRLHLVKGGSRNYDEFNMACENDPIIPDVHELWNMARESTVYHDREIFIFSGCSDIALEVTTQWLEDYGIYPDRLWMRPQDDHQKDVELKRSWLHKIQEEGYEVLFTVDDRQCVVDMWREEGITCLQCNQWDEDPDKGLDLSKGAVLNILVGPSGAGKTKYAQRESLIKRKRLAGIISSDELRRELCGYFQDQSRNDEVFAIFHADIKHHLAMGRTVYADATHLTAKARKKTVSCAPKGCEINYILIDRPLIQKISTGGWRNDVVMKDGKTLVESHHERFKSSVKYALTGDGNSAINVIDLRRN